jgi:hypothetical protein
MPIKKKKKLKYNSSPKIVHYRYYTKRRDVLLSHFCPKCGASLPDDAKFCPKCGLNIEKSSAMEDAYRGLEKQLEFQELECDIERIAELKKGLERIEKKYGTDVCTMPVAVLEKYRQMRIEAGMPPKLPGEKLNKPLLFRGKYFDALSEKILLIGENKLNETGGLLSITELTLELKKMDIKASLKDVEKTVKKLENQKVIPGIRELKSGAKLVEFIDVALSDDLREILNLAAEKGWITLADLISKTDWSKERAERALKELTEADIARYDSSYAGGNIWFFPCFKGKT